MKFSARIFMTIVYVLSMSKATIAQENGMLVDEIRHYVRYIDSINEKAADVQVTGFMKSVADGVIKINRHITGGYGIYTLSDLKGDSVFRIEYHESRSLNTYKVF